MVLILLVTSLAVERRFRGWALVAFVALGALPWVSFPAVFVLVGSGLTLCILGARRRDRSLAIRVLGAGILWAGSILVLWLVQARSLGHNRNLDYYWQYGFLPLPPRTSYGVELWQHSWTDLSSQVTITALGTIVMLLAIAGAVAMAWTSRPLVGFVVVPLVVAIVASSRRAYPFIGRVSLWTVPLLAALVASGLTAAWRFAQQRADAGRHRWVALVPAVVLLVPIAVAGGRQGLAPPGVEEVRPLVAELGAQVEPGDVVLVDHYSWPAFTYDVDRLGVEGLDARKVGDDEPPITEQLPDVDGRDRVWVLSSGSFEGGAPGSTLTPTLDSAGTRVATYEQDGAVLILYDLSG